MVRTIEEEEWCVVYQHHRAAPTVARFAPTGNLIASGDANGTLHIWSWEKTGQVKLKKELDVLQGAIKDMKWSPDGQRIVCCGEGKQARVRCLLWESGSNLGEFDGISKIANSCDFRPVKPFLVVTGSEDFQVNVYEGPPFKFKSSDRGHLNFVNCVRFSPDGRHFASCSSDARIVVHNAEEQSVVSECKDGEKAHKASVYAVDWSRDGHGLLSVSADKTAKLWDMCDITKPRLLQIFTFDMDPSLNQMQVGCTCVSESLITVSLGGTINVLDRNQPQAPRKRIRGHCRSITAIAGSLEALFCSGSYDGQVSFWEGKEIKSQARLHDNGIVGLQMLGGALVSCGLDDVLVFSSGGTREVSIPLGAAPLCMCVCPHQESVFVLTTKSIVYVCGRSIVSSTALDFESSSIAASPDVKTVAVGGKDGKIRLFTHDHGKLADQPILLERHRGQVRCLQFSSNGELLASACNNRETLVWDVLSKSIKKSRMVYHSARIDCMSFSPTDLHLATGSLDESIIVYDLGKSASARLEYKHAHAGGTTGMVWQGDGLLVTAGRDGMLRTWRVPKKE